MKKTLALLLALALVFSSLTVAFAEETISADAKAVADLGMLVGSGDGVTSAYLTTTPTRIQAAIMFLRLTGKYEAAIAFTGIDNFADAKDVAWTEGKNLMAYLKSNPELGWGGIGNDLFNPNGKMDVKSYYKVMLEALGYKQNTSDVIGDFTYPNVLNFAADHGLKAVATVTNFTVNDLATATIEALKATVNGSTTKTLAGSLVDSKVITVEKAIAAGVYTAPVVNIAVTSVSTDNLKNIVVKFNKAIDEKTATATEVKLYKNGSTTPVSLTNALVGLSTDKTVLTIADLTNFAQNDTAKVVLDGIKDASGVALAKYESSVITVKDIADPVITKLELVNSKKLVLTTTEPLVLDTAGIYKTTDVTNANVTLKIDGALSFAKFTANPAANTVTVELLNALAAGTHTISIADAKDYAGFKIASKDFTVTSATDASAPVLKSAEYVSRSQVKLTFDEEISNGGAVYGTPVFEVYQAGDTTNMYGGAGSTVSYSTTDPKVVTLTLNTLNKFNVSATVEFTVKYKNVEDMWANKTTTFTTLASKASDDTTKPTVVSYEVLAGNVVKVIFSEKVDAAGATSQFKLYKEDGTTVVDASASTVVDFESVPANVDGKTFKVTFPSLTNINSANYKVKVTGTKDLSIRENVIEDYVFALTVKDSKAPTLLTAVYNYNVDGTATNDQIQLVFSEAMDTTLLANVANYFIGKTTADVPVNNVTDAKVLSVAADGKKVTLLVPGIDGMVAGKWSAAVDKIAMPAMKDAAGNYISNASISVPFTVAGSYTAISSADIKVEATSKNTIKITALNNYTFSAADANSFKFRNSAAVAALTGTPATDLLADLGVVAAQVSADGTYITLTTAVSLTADAKADSNDADALVETLKFYTAGTGIKDQNGQSLVIDPTTAVSAGHTNVADKIVANQTTLAVGTGATANTITVSFDEAVTYAAGIAGANQTTILAAGIEIKNGTTVLTPVIDYTVAISGSDVVITVLKNGIADKDLTVEIKRPDYLVDGNANTVAVKAVQTVSHVSERVAPTVTKLGTGVAYTINSAASVQMTFSEVLSDASKTAVQSAIANGLTFSWSNNVLTITNNTGSNVTFAADVQSDITDLAGNTTSNALLIDAN